MEKDLPSAYSMPQNEWENYVNSRDFLEEQDASKSEESNNLELFDFHYSNVISFRQKYDDYSLNERYELSLISQE